MIMEEDREVQAEDDEASGACWEITNIRGRIGVIYDYIPGSSTIIKVKALCLFSTEDSQITMLHSDIRNLILSSHDYPIPEASFRNEQTLVNDE